jgi:replicative superfamily II helicase
MGKSFIMRMFIKKKIMDGKAANFVLLVPTKALINEVSNSIINDLKELLSEYRYRIVTSAGALALKQKHNFIMVLTPERLLYLLISNPSIDIDYLFIDEAHKISTKSSRSTFYYKVIDKLSRREKKAHMIFASPNIPNPEVYLKLIPDAASNVEHKLTTTFAPVSQLKYLMDFPSGDIQLYNSYNETFTSVARLKKSAYFYQLISHIGKGSQNIVYCGSTFKAVEFAREFASLKKKKLNKDLMTLSKDIKNEVHGDYYLADLISKGVAYHIGYLPSAIRMRIEELYREGLIDTIFCTSTLVEGVNLPADNLFITHYKNGRSKMSAVDFKNLIGRVGRIEYNLYGNVFLVRLEDSVKREDFVQLLKEKIPEQQLSVVEGLTNNQKKYIISNLLEGNIELSKYPKKQNNDEYAMMRKFAIILLRDITNGNRSLVWHHFSELLDQDVIDIIKVYHLSPFRYSISLPPQH